MLILISPAKSMDNSKIYKVENTTYPRFEKETKMLVENVQRLSCDEIEKIFKVSPPLAISTFQRYHNFDLADRNPAILSYIGTVFKRIKASQFSQSDLDYAQQHLRIISVLYGVLRPLDLIAEYRLEYKTKLEGVKRYDFWKPMLTEVLIEDVKQAGGVLLNLGSLDLLPALDLDLLKRNVRVINVEFKSLKNDKYINIQTYSKIERGELTHYILKNQLPDIESVKKYNREGYSYNCELSDDETIVFTK